MIFTEIGSRAESNELHLTNDETKKFSIQFWLSDKCPFYKVVGRNLFKTSFFLMKAQKFPENRNKASVEIVQRFYRPYWQYSKYI